MITKELIQHKSAELLDELIGIRRHLHQYPELSFQEENTARYISNMLTSWGVDHRIGIAGHGIVGVIKGVNPEKRIIALRADMDALPISENNNIPYKSLNTGVMHACGHDAHMTCLLGSIKILHELRNEFEGSVKFIFQPAEENLPGGAKHMISEGVLNNPDVEMIIGQHVLPELASGKIGIRSGIYMASSDEINLIISGKGGHGAMPKMFNDTVLAMAQMIVSLQQIVSRKAPPQTPTVLSFGKVIANGAHNVIPSEVKIHGTFRTFDEDWRKEAHQLIKQTAHYTAKAFSVECKVIIDSGYPVLVNDHEETEFVRQNASFYLGDEQVSDLEIRTTVEDFAYYLQKVPGCFYRLGIRNEDKNIVSNLHTDTFDIDEKAIETGTGLMTWLTLQRLDK